DIHSNLEALECVLSEIERRKADQIVCLGDVVGYGANPSECLKLVREISQEVIMGNHDQAIEDIKLRDYFNDWAREAIEWTAGKLSSEEKRQIRDFTPVVIDRKRNVTWTHGSLHEPEEYRYLFRDADAKPSFKILETDFCFFGHTHIPSLFADKTHESRYLTAGSYRLLKGERYLINPGSVGQPRDHDSRLSFAMFDSDDLALEIVRLGYDNQKAARKISKAGLPAYLADRLL
ncbi:MAG: metallophosphoesterase family protein, partial [Candidatus Omnitrophica bacterium]|nr:metallophosphoesterase family protein [Candidatus Omnitrophota bacterium]